MKTIAICAGLALFVMARGAAAETIFNKQSPNLCLADNNNRQKAVVWSCNGNSDQTWTETSVYGSWGVMFSNGSGGGCLGPYSDADPGTLNESLYMEDCGRQFQYVKLDAGPNCHYIVTLNSFLTYLSTGDRSQVLAIGVLGALNTVPPKSGQALVLWTLNGDENQKWCFR